MGCSWKARALPAGVLDFIRGQQSDQSSGGGAVTLDVLLPTMVVVAFGPEHLKKLQRLHEDLIRRLDHLRTMLNPIVKRIHQTQGIFLSTAIDLTGYALQRMGQGLQYAGIVLSFSGIGAEGGAAVYGVSKFFTWAGTGIRVGVDAYDGNYADAAIEGGSLFLFNGLSKVGKVAQLTEDQQFIWDSILIPFNETLNKFVE